MKTRLAACWMGFAVAALAAGCGGERDAMQKQIAGLRAEIMKVRADSVVLSERLEAVELSRGGARGQERRAAGPDAAEAPADRPALDVVHLGPEDDAARPALRSGSGGAVIQEDAGEPPKVAKPSPPPRRKP